MDGKRLIRSIKLTNFLSFGSSGAQIELEPLNVLIGPNTSGKSNFIEAIELLHAAPGDLAAAIRRGGGAAEWAWKGGDPVAAAWVEALVVSFGGSLRYCIGFAKVGQRHELVSESVAPEQPMEDDEGLPLVFYELQPDRGRATVCVKVPSEKQSPNGPEWTERSIPPPELNLAQSVLSQLKDPVAYPAITHLANVFGAVKLYREWEFGPDSALRKPCRADDPDDFLLEDASNLGMILNDLRNRPDAWKLVMENLKRFCDSVEDVSTKIQGGTVQIFFHERGLKRPVPATRLSDGTLRCLCLLAVLCHPEPPPLVVIEEPELGLHPDALGLVAELLIDASKRMQIVVTTHSPSLVSKLSEVPEAVVVCERDDEGSHLRRLDKDRLEEWLEDYSLGDLWLMGEIGGNP